MTTIPEDPERADELTGEELERIWVAAVLETPCPYTGSIAQRAYERTRVEAEEIMARGGSIDIPSL